MYWFSLVRGKIYLNCLLVWPSWIVLVTCESTVMNGHFRVTFALICKILKLVLNKCAAISKRGTGTSAGSFPEHRLVIEPNSLEADSSFSITSLIVLDSLQWPFSQYVMLNTVVAVCYVNETNIFNWFSWSRLSEWRFGDRYHTHRRGESFI